MLDRTPPRLQGLVETISPQPSGARAWLARSVARWHFVAAAQLGDAALIVLTSIFTYRLYGHALSQLPLRYLAVTGIISALFIFALMESGLYNVRTRDDWRAIRSIAVRWSLIFLGLAALAALSHQTEQYSRLWFVTFFCVGLIVLATKCWLSAWASRIAIDQGYGTQKIAFIGASNLTEKLLSRFSTNSFGLHIVGVFDDQSASQTANVDGNGTISDLVQYARHHPLDTVVIAIPLARVDDICEAIIKLRELPVSIRILPDVFGFSEIASVSAKHSELPGVQLVTVQDKPIPEPHLLMKCVFDKTLAIIALILFAPVMILCIFGIMMSDPGPIFFQQARIGYNGRGFQILKFRTMRHNAQRQTDLTTRDDPRVYAFGSFLRRFSLDELPQLINVIRGEMSLVGPRPHMPEARAAGRLYIEAVDRYAQRHRVKPGMTGWAQVNGWRGPTDTLEQLERRIEHDIYYIENWSLILDLAILFRTATGNFQGKNAF